MQVLVRIGLLEHELLASLVRVQSRGRQLRVERHWIRKTLMHILLGSLLLSLKLGLELVLLVLELAL